LYVGKYIDFVVEYDKDPKVVGKRIITNIITQRLKYKKPVIIFIAGDSGEGKSYAALKIMEIINEFYGVKSDVATQVIYTPLDYATKIDTILYDKKFKKYRLVILDEARELLKAKLWYSFINRAMADINAMMRKIKPIAFIVVSQFIKDVDADMRRTLTFYIKASRPLGKKTRLQIYRMWKDDRDIERPTLKKRRLRGFVIKNGKRILFKPKYFRVSLPQEDVRKKYEEMNYSEKSKIIKRKLNKLMIKINEELGNGDERTVTLAKWYAKHPQSLSLIMTKYRGKLKLKKDIQKLHDLTRKEAKHFQAVLFEELQKEGLMESHKNNEENE